MAYQSINPFSGKLEKTFNDLSPAELESKLASAENCFQTDWRNRSFAQRTAILKRADRADK